MSDATPPFSVPYLSSVKPGVLDQTQPARILRNPSSVLIFATYDSFVFATVGLDVAHPPNTRIIVERTPGPGQENWFRLIPQARFGPGVQDEKVSWPKVILINGRSAILEWEQWEIYKLDPAYDCFLPSPGELPTITWIGIPSTRPAPSADTLTKGEEIKRPGGLNRHSFASGSSAGFASSTDSASSTSSTSSTSTLRPAADGPEMNEEEFASLLNSSAFKNFVANMLSRSRTSVRDDPPPATNRHTSSAPSSAPTMHPSSNDSRSTSSVPLRAPYDLRFYDVPTEFAEPAPGSSGPGTVPFAPLLGHSTSSFTPTPFSAPYAAPSGSASHPTPPMCVAEFVASARASFTPSPMPTVPSSLHAPPPVPTAPSSPHSPPTASMSSSMPSATRPAATGPAATGPEGFQTAVPSPGASAAAPAASASSSMPSATNFEASRVGAAAPTHGGPGFVPLSGPSGVSGTFTSDAGGPTTRTKGLCRGAAKSSRKNAKPYARPPQPSTSGPVSEPFFMSAPFNRAGDPDALHFSEGSTFHFQVPPQDKQKAFKPDSPTPSPVRQAAPEALFCFNSSSSETLQSTSVSPSSASSSSTVRPCAKSPEIVDLTMEDDEDDEGKDQKDVPEVTRPVKRKHPLNMTEPRKRKRGVSPDTERADARLKNAHRKRDQRAHAEKVKDEGTKERDARLWQEIFAGARKDGKYSMSNPLTQGDGMDVDHDAAIKESKKKLVDLAKDQPLWDAEASKRSSAMLAEKARRDAAEAAAEGERCRVAEAKAEEERRAAKAALRAEQLTTRIEQERQETSQRQRLRWSPWNPSRAIPRYLELSEVFDWAKFTPERPVDPLMIPWPVLRTPFSLRPRDIEWPTVEAFFAKAKGTMTTPQYKAFVAASNIRFHPDTWSKLGVLTSKDKAMNAELGAACVVVSQALTTIWKASRTLR